MPGTPMRELACRFVLVTDRPHYTWNDLSCATELRAADRHGEINLTKSILPNPNQSCQINPAKSKKQDSLSNEQQVLTILKIKSNTNPIEISSALSGCQSRQHLHCLHSF